MAQSSGDLIARPSWGYFPGHVGVKQSSWSSSPVWKIERIAWYGRSSIDSIIRSRPLEKMKEKTDRVFVCHSYPNSKCLRRQKEGNVRCPQPPEKNNTCEFPKAPALLVPHHLIVHCPIQDTRWKVSRLCRDAVGVFYSPSRLGKEELGQYIFVCEITELLPFSCDGGPLHHKKYCRCPRKNKLLVIVFCFL